MVHKIGDDSGQQDSGRKMRDIVMHDSEFCTNGTFIKMNIYKLPASLFCRPIFIFCCIHYGINLSTNLVRHGGLVRVCRLVFWFLVGWTSSVCQNLERQISLIGQGQTSDHLIFSMCLVERWDYMTAAGTWSLGLCGCLLFARQHDNGLPQKPCQTLSQTLEEFYPFGFGKTIL